MKLHPLILGLTLHAVFSMTLSAADTHCVEKLKEFSAYEQGKPLAWLIEARREVFLGTADEAVRSQRESELLDFIASDAHPQAKSIAIEWLGSLGSKRCVPRLSAAGKDPALAAPVAAALVRIEGLQAPHAPAMTASKAAAEVARFSRLLETTTATPAADELIAAALRSPNDLLAGSALRRIRSGAGSSALMDKLLAELDQLPVGRQTMLCEALTTRPALEKSLSPVLTHRIISGDPVTRATSLRSLGRILRPEDLPMVLELAATVGEPNIATAARAALMRATHSGINPELRRIAESSGTVAIAAIDALSARHASDAAASLWSLTTAEDSKIRAAANKALGNLIPPRQLPELLDRLTAPHGGPATDELAKLIWEVARRHPDPAEAAVILHQAATDAPTGTRELLVRYATRIQPKPPTSATLNPELPRLEDRDKLIPNGHEQAAYMNCGAFAEARGGKIAIRRMAGQSYQFGGVAHPLATVDFGKEIIYEISGLDGDSEYVVGFSAWDAGQENRRQSFLVNGREFLTNFAPLAWHGDKPTYARIHLPLPRAATASGKATITMKSVSGPNAVISELWLLRRTAEAPAKRIVIVTGDDHPAHFWRETGPEFAAILRADPLLEVTVSESPALLESPALSSYDAVFLHFKNYNKRQTTSEPLWKNLEAYVNGGGGLVIAHFGCGAMQEWNGFAKLAGRVWDPRKRGHDPYGEFQVRIVTPGHPAIRALKEFDTRDELYTCLAGDTGIQVLAEATSKVDQSIHPMAFVLTPGKGRVFHSPLGHDLRALKSAGVRDLYLHGTRWAAGL